MKRFVLILTSAALMVSGSASVADEPAAAADLKRLQQNVQLLRAQVDSLLALKPSFTNFMPVFSERFHVMHYAADAGDWMVAAHELSELGRLLKVAVYVDRKNGEMMQGFLGGHFTRLNDAIHHANLEGFVRELDRTIESCNACHMATGSPFIRVTLDAADALSFRHAHTLQRSQPPAHMHTH